MSFSNDAVFSAVIAAGGTGSRFGTEIPKQFVEINGVPIIAHTINKFESCPLISEIVIVTHPDFIVYCRDMVKELGFGKVTAIVCGGSTRQQSVFLGLKQLNNNATHVLIHDAARPAIDESTIAKCCEGAVEYSACAAGVRVVDTIKISDDGEFITSTADRSKMWQIQTPQAFEKSLIYKYHQNAAFEGFEATDDCMLAERYGAKVKLIQGNSDNIKITTYRDLALMEGLL